ncbi:putative WEB family protein At1g65010, chloroplastic [Rhodamnia argentea]|uniref:WEB family protein At1g65010, chloroplastic n=1 Tax=Rhodamnia argentea TaxID=178133 RepID=A0A8B8P0H1_9MYRT|nr:putative WEB family protein At1g65010, chloroplastic [Rhodamnia argentea]XP_048127160.1 putative WEB family protein At1g65010, chloroplastic [Rhodamnia argentea]
MQQDMAEFMEEMRTLRERLNEAEDERDQMVVELRESWKAAEEANARLTEAFAARKVPRIYTELNSVKKLLANASQELKVKEKEMESLRVEAARAKQLELELADREAALEKLEEELSDARGVEAEADSQSERRIWELEEELRNGKESEGKTFESMVALTKQLEQTKISLEEAKLEIGMLREKLERFEEQPRQNGKAANISRICFKDNVSPKVSLESLRSELQSTKESLSRAQEGEKNASSKVQGLLDEIGKLKNELKSSNEAEENSKKAMDDLALALKEVATETNQVKLKLDVTQAELEHCRGEAKMLTEKLKNTEDKFRELLDQSRKEMEQYKNTSERLRLEAEESHLAWNGKETGFVGCIRRAEDEKTAAQQENIRLAESLRAADRMVKASREENIKLRDILKQALNEASVAKEAASIARAENSQLKDELAEKDDALNFLSREIESLRINEVVAMENIMELKRMLSEKDIKTDDKEIARKSKASNSNTASEKEHKEGRRLGKAFSFNLKDLIVHHHHHPRHKDGSDNLESKEKEEDDEDKDKDSPENIDPLKGSIFDVMDSPGSAAHHRKKSSSAFTSDGETMNSEDVDSLDLQHFDDLENERLHRRKRALLHRFSDILRRRSYAEKSHH